MTMKANELMIGDYIYQHHPKDNTPHIVKVSADTFDLMYRMEIGFIQEQSPLYRIIEPIPLTPEILEKNGFHINGIPNSITSVKAIDDWSDDTYVWSRQETPDERMFVSVYIDDPANFFVEVYCQYCHVDGIHVKYLHQLQNALKLCGIDKEIVL